jgi:hypothetical protein
MTLSYFNSIDHKCRISREMDNIFFVRTNSTHRMYADNKSHHTN